MSKQLWRDHAYAGGKRGVGTHQGETAIAKFSNLAMRRQSGIKYGRELLVEMVQHAGMGEKFPKTRISVLHQRLNAFNLAAGFF